MDFVHLHAHSHYSLLDGACRIDDLTSRCAEYNMPALALTDHGNMFGAIEFYNTALKAGIKPIVGVEAYVAPGKSEDKGSSTNESETSYHLVLLVKDIRGYKNLMKLVSHGYLKGFYYKPRIDKALLREHREGLIALSGCLKGEVSRKLLNNSPVEARAAAVEYRELFGDDYYLEIQNHGLDEEETVRAQILQIASELSIPLVATNDVHYLKREHHQPHDILLCLQTGKDLDDPNRMRYSTDQIYFKSTDEMWSLFQDIPEALENTLAVAEKCHLVLDAKTKHLPHYHLPEGEKAQTFDQYLQGLVQGGVRKRYREVTDELLKRIQYELEVIRKAGYAGYFLIVQDFINYARSQGIPVGPGRGSAAGSLVSYVLGITNIDPIKYGLVFERFLNLDRLTLPDIDIDFCYERRGEIIDYVRKKYGEDNVAQIITFGTMAARAVIRDVGRVLKISYGEVDRIAKMIPATPGMSLTKALEQVPDLAELIKSDSKLEKLFDYSKILEGLARHASTHAAGVVITPHELTNYVPLFKTKEDDITTQYDMKCLAEIGLLKMDFLGLRTLTVIDKTVKAANSKGAALDIDRIPLDDVETYNIFSSGKTVGIFQFESAGMQECLKKLSPESLEDLIAMNALYRPGPMDWIDNFIARRHGRKEITYLHPMLEPILKETYGIVIYQEQVMRIASEIGGFNMSEADQVRWAMGKKIFDMMKEQRQQFVEGAVKKNVSREIATEIFNQMEAFAGYGFNKSHAAGYALIAYQTAYLKAHYPAEFMAATLTSEMGNTSRVVTLIDECRKMKIPVLPPNVNESYADFVVTEAGILFGLGAVKNVGMGAIESIVRAREKEGPFVDIFDFCKRVDSRLANKKVLESLIQAGAMDSLAGHRAQLMEVIDTAAAFAQEAHAERASGQTNIFGEETAKSSLQPVLPEIAEWKKTELLSREKNMLGFYVSGHPLFRYEEEVRTFASLTLDELEAAQDSLNVKICGIVTEIRTQIDSKGNIMVFFKIEDFTGTAECLMFSDAYTKYRQFLHSDAMVMLVGKISSREDKGSKIIANEVIPLAEVKEKFTKSINLVMDLAIIKTEMLSKLGIVLDSNKGECPVFLTLKSNGEEFALRSRQYTINPTVDLINTLREILGKENVWIGR